MCFEDLNDGFFSDEINFENLKIASIWRQITEQLLT
jgi:hypothetical protein